MYRNILPYSSHRDHTDIQGHQDTVSNAYGNHKRRSPHSPLARAIRSGARHMRNALRRSSTARSTRTIN